MLLENFTNKTTLEKLEWYKKELEKDYFRGRSLQKENQIYETIAESIALIKAQQTQIKDLSLKVHKFLCEGLNRY